VGRSVSPIKKRDVRRAVEASRKPRGANKFPSEAAIKAAFAAGAAVVEIVRPDGTKITIRKDSAETTEDIRDLIK
jgi:hypothetical protein